MPISGSPPIQEQSGAQTSIFYRAPAATWTASNPILGVNEVGQELDTGAYKIGDGATAWNLLSYTGLVGPEGPPGTTLWSGITDKPSTFTPSSHAHAPADVTGTAVVTNDSRLSDARQLADGADKTKLDGIAAGAEVNVSADWSSGAGDSQILNKPTLGTAAAKNVPATGDASSTEVVYGTDTRLTNARTPSAHAHAPTDVTGTAVITNDSRLSDARTPTAHNQAISTITNLQTTLDGKEPANANIQTHVVSAHAPSNAQKNSDIIQSEIEAKLTGVISTHSHTGGTTIGYAINVQALTSSPGDGATVYFGMLPKAPVSTANVSKCYVRAAGTIKRVEIYCYSGTAGTGEAWSLYIRKNNTTDTLIATLAVSASERVFTNAALNISMAAGDYFEIKSVQPTWVTNPLTCVYGGYVYIE